MTNEAQLSRLLNAGSTVLHEKVDAGAHEE